MFFRCGYSTMNHAMCYPFVLIITIFVRSLFNFSIMMIPLTVVLYHRLWLIIWGIMLSTRFPIMNWYFSLKLFVFGITIFWPICETWQLIGGLVPIIYNYWLYIHLITQLSCLKNPRHIVTWPQYSLDNSSAASLLNTFMYLRIILYYYNVIIWKNKYIYIMCSVAQCVKFLWPI